jgi:hypothetical protein
VPVIDNPDEATGLLELYDKDSDYSVRASDSVTAVFHAPIRGRDRQGVAQSVSAQTRNWSRKIHRETGYHTVRRSHQTRADTVTSHRRLLQDGDYFQDRVIGSLRPTSSGLASGSTSRYSDGFGMVDGVLPVVVFLISIWAFADISSAALAGSRVTMRACYCALSENTRTTLSIA